MRLFTRYMAKRFIGPFLFGLGLFALLIFLGDMFDKMGYLVRSKATLGVILQYLLYAAPPASMIAPRSPDRMMIARRESRSVFA